MSILFNHSAPDRPSFWMWIKSTRLVLESNLSVQPVALSRLGILCVQAGECSQYSCSFVWLGRIFKGHWWCFGSFCCFVILAVFCHNKQVPLLSVTISLVETRKCCASLWFLSLYLLRCCVSAWHMALWQCFTSEKVFLHRLHGWLLCLMEMKCSGHLLYVFCFLLYLLMASAFQEINTILLLFLNVGECSEQ